MAHAQAPAFPSRISLTITNACNLRCRMCGQWSEAGYIRCEPGRLRDTMELRDWIRVVDEVADHGVGSVLVRGGEPFVYPEIVALLKHIHGKGMYIAIDTNGTRLEQFAADLVRIGQVHITVSVDGPEAIHDQVRGVPGTFAALRRGLEAIAAEEKRQGQTISKSINFTISPWSVAGLGELPDVARSLGMKTLCIVPYYYMPAKVREEYRRQLAELGVSEYSGAGFEHDESGVDGAVFRKQYERFSAGLGEVASFPYLPLTLEEYLTWFGDAVKPVRMEGCRMVEELLDIQPDGRANFCVDFPDYSPGNVRERTISEIWNSEAAQWFRDRRRQGPLGACHRCGAKYMAEMK